MIMILKNQIWLYSGGSPKVQGLHKIVIFILFQFFPYSIRCTYYFISNSQFFFSFRCHGLIYSHSYQINLFFLSLHIFFLPSWSKRSTFYSPFLWHISRNIISFFLHNIICFVYFELFSPSLTSFFWCFLQT